MSIEYVLMAAVSKFKLNHPNIPYSRHSGQRPVEMISKFRIKIFMFVCLVINILVMIVITWFIQASWLPCTNIKITSKHFTVITKSKERIYDFIWSHHIQYDLQRIT